MTDVTQIGAVGVGASPHTPGDIFKEKKQGRSVLVQGRVT